MYFLLHIYYLQAMNKVKCPQFLFYHTGTARFFISSILLSGYGIMVKIQIGHENCIIVLRN